MKAQLTGLVVAAMAVALAASAASAQYAGGPSPIQPAGGAGPMFVDPAAAYAGCDVCDAYGDPIDPNMLGGHYGAAGGYGAGSGYDQCGPHYFDVSADFLYWRRDGAADHDVAFTSLGINGPRILTTSDLDINYEPGFRVTGRLDIGPNSLVEASYFGTLHLNAAAQVTSATNQLYSVFSEFGLDPFNGLGFTDTDNALVHRLEYASELNNAEINFRQYWVAGDPRISGTWLMGARYARLTEDFRFYTQTNTGWMDYAVSTENDLVGFQVGGDAAMCVVQGFRLTGEGKIGIYNNRIKQRTAIVATTIHPDLLEAMQGNTVAMIAEGRVGFVTDILPSWSIRGGYEAVWMTSVALAANNFNAQPPFLGGVRTPFLDDDANALYHGAYAGLEYTW